jgi:uncharacterized protein YcgI (DUF1989 family)
MSDRDMDCFCTWCETELTDRLIRDGRYFCDEDCAQQYAARYEEDA